MKKQRKKKNRLIPRPVKVFFWCSLLFMIYAKTCMSNDNIQLSAQEQQLIQEIEKKEEVIADLENDVKTLEEKTRILGMLDNGVTDNQNNVYVIGD